MTINLTPDIGSNFCYAPWTNIHINPLGVYKTCCAGQSELGNLREVDLNSAMSHGLLTEIKTAIINNQEHENCRICIDREQHTPVTERTWYHDIAERQTIPIVALQDQPLQNLDIRWSNTCNLSCVYCGSEASSIWARLKGQPLERADYTNIQGIMNYITAHQDTIKNLGLLGGEPLLQKENELLLGAIGNDVHVNVITNLSVPLERNKIFNQLIKLPNVTWDISFETVKDRFEYVRHGADWNLMLYNIKTLRELAPHQSVNVTGQFSVYNCLNISEVHEYFADHALPPIRWAELTYPHRLSAFSLPNELMQQSARELIKSIKYNPNSADFFKEQANNLLKANNPDAETESLYAWHAEQEQTYWPDAPLKFANLWPEFK
jgi:sulfatase maturation enzyme AslB (radical SAM superfamily)